MGPTRTMKCPYCSKDMPGPSYENTDTDHAVPLPGKRALLLSQENCPHCGHSVRSISECKYYAPNRSVDFDNILNIWQLTGKNALKEIPQK